MPTLGTVDYSPIANAIRGKGAAGQANFSEDFAKLQKKEQQRQNVVGAIQGVIEVAGSVYGLLEQSKMEIGKQKLLQKNADTQQIIQEARLNGQIGIEQGADGTYSLRVDDEVKQAFEAQQASIDDDKTFNGFGRVKQQLTTSLTQMQQTALTQAKDEITRQGLADGEAAYQQNLKTAFDLAVNSEDITGLYDTIHSNGMLSPQGKEADWTKAQKAYGLAVAEKQAVSAARPGGLAAGLEAISKTGFDEADKAALRQSVTASVKADVTTATEVAGQVYDEAKAGDRFVPDSAIKDIAKGYPSWMREDVEAALRKRQTQDNLQKYTAQFNQDRDNSDLRQLKAQYERVQSSPDFKGDEATRSLVMGWYEGLIGHAGSGSEKDAEESAQRLGEAIVSNFQNGFTKGPEALRSIEELMNANRITGPQAKGFKERITAHQFPQAEPFLKGADKFAMSALGIKDAKKMTTADQTRVSTLSATYTSFLSDKLFENGGSVTPEQLAKYQNEALTALTAKAFDDMRVGVSLFKSRDTMTEEAVARTLSAYDSPSGRTAVFQDSKTGQIQYLSEDPAATRETHQKLVDYAKEQLEARGVTVTGEKLEAEGEYDVTGIPIFTGSDGMQYRPVSESGKVKFLTRGSSDAQWRPAAPSPSEAKAAEDQARKAEESRLAGEMEAASRAHQGYIMKRDTTSAAALEAKRKFEAAKAALEAFRKRPAQEESVRDRRLGK